MLRQNLRLCETLCRHQILWQTAVRRVLSTYRRVGVAALSNCPTTAGEKKATDDTRPSGPPPDLTL